MIGPSSSHTAGVVRIALAARRILGMQPETAVITFYNSFATTYEGHGSDRAALAGLLGYSTDDARIRDAASHAEEAGLKWQFKPVGNAGTLHPNSIRLKLTAGEHSAEVLGESLGGGVINIKEVNGFTANISGNTSTLMILADDVKGSIAFIADILSHDDCNIATMTCSRKGKNDIACLFIETDSEPRKLSVQYMESLRWVREIHYMDRLG